MGMSNIDHWALGFTWISHCPSFSRTKMSITVCEVISFNTTHGIQEYQDGLLVVYLAYINNPSSKVTKLQLNCYFLCHCGGTFKDMIYTQGIKDLDLAK